MRISFGSDNDHSQPQVVVVEYPHPHQRPDCLRDEEGETVGWRESHGGD